MMTYIYKSKNHKSMKRTWTERKGRQEELLLHLKLEMAAEWGIVNSVNSMNIS